MRIYEYTFKVSMSWDGLILACKAPAAKGQHEVQDEKQEGDITYPFPGPPSDTPYPSPPCLSWMKEGMLWLLG